MNPDVAVCVRSLRDLGVQLPPGAEYMEPEGFVRTLSVAAHALHGRGARLTRPQPKDKGGKSKDDKDKGEKGKPKKHDPFAPDGERPPVYMGTESWIDQMAEKVSTPRG